MIFAIFLTSCGGNSSDNDEEGSITTSFDNVEISTVITLENPTESSEVTLKETTVTESIETSKSEVYEVTPTSFTSSTVVNTIETSNVTNSTTPEATTVTTTATTSTTSVRTPVITTETTTYIPDSSKYIGIAIEIAAEYGCEVYVGADWSSYRNPILLDASLSDSIFEQYVREVMQELISHGNGYRSSFQVWVSDERTSGNQTHGPGFYLYIG